MGALNYALDQLDILPDHYRGIGVADDAMVLRLAARQAIAAGATHAGLRALADDTAQVEAVLEDLTAPLEKYVALLPDKKVRGLNSFRLNPFGNFAPKPWWGELWLQK